MTNSSRRHFLSSMGVGAAALAVRPVFSPGRAFGEIAEPPQDADVHLNFNESPYGPSPRAIKAIRDSAVALYGRYYPEDTYDTLTRALAAHHSVTTAHIRVAVGSTEILKVCDDVFVSRNARLVVAEPAYEAVVQYAANSKADTIKVPLDALHVHDLTRMADAAAGAGAVYICNPNNPTGTIVRRDVLARFMEKIPASVMVVVDEAYSEFVTDPEYESAVRYVREGRNVVVAKTFSKIHGLAGMRVGYAIAAPNVIDKLKPFTVDFAVTGLGANAALASLGDQAYLTTVARRNAAMRQAFVAEMKRYNFECPASQANFVMVDLRKPVAAVIADLATRHVLVGRVFPSMPNFMRVTLGTESEMNRFYSAFRSVISA
jgi:histidinol-phosphate aminotransferase